MEAISLSQLTQRITAMFARAADLQCVWITAETSGVQLKGGHCYMELSEKDPETGSFRAKIRATIWASTYYRIISRFQAETGQTFRSDLKVMVLVSANFHPVFGLSLNIVDINSEYTLGDVIQRRNRMIARLKQEGIFDMNRELPLPAVPLRLAIISAPMAAGYGDFMKRLYENPYRLRFVTRLFSATMQGENTAPTVIAALDAIAAEADDWDCVLIIRGGGSSNDLLSFDDYDMAANIANFPLPVITGIGHERDTTLLDFVANVSCITPTAAAEMLIQRGAMALGRLHDLGSRILRAVTDRLKGCAEQLAYYSGSIPGAATGVLQRASARLTNAQMRVASVADRHIRPEMVRLGHYSTALTGAVTMAISRSRQRIDDYERLVNALSPQATLRRGYSITRVDGHCITSAAGLPYGSVVETLLADGKIYSSIIPAHPDSLTPNT